MNLVDGGRKEMVLTSPLKFAVSGDVPAHSWVSAPCGAGCNSTRIKNLPNEASELVTNVVKSWKLLQDSLPKKAWLRTSSLLTMPIRREAVN
jgi:hypothetical protein